VADPIGLAAELQRWLDCATEALDPPVGRSFIAPGLEVAWDDCCDGQVWVRLLQLIPLDQFNTRKASGHNCAVDVWEITAAVGVVRCVHSLNDDGQAPPPDAITLDGVQMAEDMQALMGAIQCCIQPGSFVRWNPTGPSGGCAGGEWQFVIRIEGCGCVEVP
jgi:hypothetical protein